MADDKDKPAVWSEDEVSVVGSPAETLHKINERTKLSSAAALKTMNAATTTLDRVEDVRKELTGHIRDVDSKLGVLQVAHAVVETKLDGIATTLQEDRVLRQQHQHLRAAAELEVDKTTKLADIEVSKTDRLATIGEKTKWGDTWRGIAVKVAASVGVIISAFAAGKGC